MKRKLITAIQIFLLAINMGKKKKKSAKDYYGPIKGF